MFLFRLAINEFANYFEMVWMALGLSLSADYFKLINFYPCCQTNYSLFNLRINDIIYSMAIKQQ